MTKKRLPIIIFFCIIILPVLLYQFFSYKASLEYRNATLPNYALEKETNKILYFDSLKKLAQRLIGGEEYFIGNINIRGLDHDKVEITMHNDATGDDTREAIEYYVVAERRKAGWEITRFKMHWKCSRGLYWPRFWTTTGCS